MLCGMTQLSYVTWLNRHLWHDSIIICDLTHWSYGAWLDEITHTHKRTHAHTQTHTCIHTHAHTFTHTHTSNMTHSLPVPRLIHNFFIYQWISHSSWSSGTQLMHHLFPPKIAGPTYSLTNSHQRDIPQPHQDHLCYVFLYRPTIWYRTVINIVNLSRIATKCWHVARPHKGRFDEGLLARTNFKNSGPLHSTFFGVRNDRRVKSTANLYRFKS